MKIKLMFFIVTIIFLITTVLNAEKIKNYKVTVQINIDRSVTIDEVIDYDIDSTIKHGIYRDIPLKIYENENKKGEFLKMNFIKKDKRPENYKSETYKGGVAYRIGSPKKSLDKRIHKYEINYTVFNAINEHNGIYQLYFNVLPQFWEVPIEKADITVKLSKDMKIDKKEIEKLEIYTGKKGEQGDNYVITSGEGTIKIRSKESFPENNGMTIMLNLKTDKLQITFKEKMKLFYYEKPVIVLGSAILIFLIVYGLITWIIVGRDPEKRTVIPEFRISENITPIEAAYINGERKSEKLLNIGIMSLLSKGYIIIEDKKSDGENVKYFLNQEKSHTEKKIELKEDEKEILSALSTGDDIFRNGFSLYRAMSNISKKLKRTYEKEIFINNRKYLFPFRYGLTIIIFLSVISNGIGTALGIFETMILFLICFIFTLIYSTISRIIDGIIKNKIIYKTFLTGVILFVCLGSGLIPFYMTLTVFIFYFIYQKIIGRYTEEGLRKKEYLIGMQMYIKTAEENKIEKFNDITQLISYFKSMLPFSLALGLTNEAINLMEKSVILSGFGEKFENVVQEINISSFKSSGLSDSIYRNYKKREKNYQSSRSSSKKSKGNSGNEFNSGKGSSGGGSGGGGGRSW